MYDDDRKIVELFVKALNAYLFASIKNKCYTYRCKKDVLRVPVDYTTINVAAEAAEALDEEVVEKVVAIIENMPEQTRNVLIGGVNYIFPGEFPIVRIFAYVCAKI